MTDNFDQEVSLEELRAAEEYSIEQGLEQLVAEGLMLKKIVGGEAVYKISEAGREVVRQNEEFYQRTGEWVEQH